MVDLDALRDALAVHGRVVRVVVADVRGSAPREVGAEMIVAASGLVAGTIGGGALELEAIGVARELAAARVGKRALGPDLGQCCGGAVVLAWDLVTGMPEVENGLVVRRIDGTAERPLSVVRAIAGGRNGAAPAATRLIDGWLISPVRQATAEVWVWGAGHVGRAIVGVIAPLPGVAVTWVDTAAERFPETLPQGVTALPAARPETLAAHAPVTAHHLILTYSHAIDLALCDALLHRGFASAGVIGSKSKWARFRSRLSAMGHATARIDGIACPIGNPGLGKHPQQIAVGVAATLLSAMARKDAQRDMTG
ncbi:xanthine dehydrogenase accessory protein XdhC [Primorskyibacter flagellatus]|uniref:Xanthine dehydrogenase accessory protein XdhC n=1 Tax=Primorskyibacter flagellatus TaxID=1387277 RepID=A0A917ABL6_9RHOB|nr:xanthine dehydrogenase accessory protein XdhC [Primorskyibacter flagellatus]GGE40020.1 xanthine dehydrogenase accessory protein XdhC [Primorskyibacter flagellatus]